MAANNSAVAGAARDASRHVDVPLLGSIAVPDPSGMAFYAGLGALAAAELIEWPVALIVAAGHLLSHQSASHAFQGLGEALESA